MVSSAQLPQEISPVDKYCFHYLTWRGTAVLVMSIPYWRNHIPVCTITHNYHLQSWPHLGVVILSTWEIEKNRGQGNGKHAFILW